MSRALFVATLLVAATASDFAVAPASACPTCGEANGSATGDETVGETNVRPRAYMYSILFMLSMPVMIFGGFGIALYRMTRAEQTAGDPSIRDGLDQEA